MQVDADIDESDVAKVHVGQIAQFTVDAMPTRTFEAVVRQVRKSATNIQNVITYDAVMDVPNPGSGASAGHDRQHPDSGPGAGERPAGSQQRSTL